MSRCVMLCILFCHVELLAVYTESSTTSQEYCEDETFTATCGKQQVVVMETARYVIVTLHWRSGNALVSINKVNLR